MPKANEINHDWLLTSISSDHGAVLSESAEALLPPLTACLLVGGARSSVLWPADLFLSSILMKEGRDGADAATGVIRLKELNSS